VSYSGFDDQRRRELARAVRDSIASGPVYLHCHHAKHRSAGALAAAGVCLGWGSDEQMIERMNVSGINPKYRGLFDVVRRSRALESTELDSVPAEFPEVAEPLGFVASMVELDILDDRLKLIESAGWETPKDHPELVPVAEAGRMVEVYRQLAEERRSTKQGSGEIAALFTKAHAQAQVLEDLLAAQNRNVQKLAASYAAIARSCKNCHERFRD
jgi:predicted secreted protein